MAATGKTPILLYGSTTATNAPTAGNLTNSSDGCEIAINVADKNLFFKDSTNAINTVPIRQSSSTSNGWLSSTDWNTFNNKQPAGTYVTSVTGTAPVVSSGGTTPAISMAAANGSTNGYLTSTDWNTFNNKVSSQWITSGSNIYYSTGNVGIGRTPSYLFDTQAGASGRIAFTTTTAADRPAVYFLDNAGGYQYGAFRAYDFTFDNGSSTFLKIASTGGVSIGNTTDPGAGNLSVNGNVVISTSGKGIDFSATAGTGTSELLADYEEGTWTPTPVNLTVVGSATYTGKYTKIGRAVYWSIQVSPSGGSTTASTLTTTTFTGLPYTVNAIATCQAATGAIGSLLNGYVTGTTVYPPAWTATGADVSITGTYIV